VIVLADGFCAVHSPSRRPVPAGPKPSGLDGEGRWVPEFPEQRPPFARGNGLALKAGDRALLRLKPRAAEIAVELRELVPVWSESFGPVVDACAMVGAQVEAAFSALADAVDPESVKWLDERARRWATLYLRSLDALSLTPASLAQRGLDLSQAARSEQLRRHIEERYGGGGDG
jgi:hypothetical protein